MEAIKFVMLTKSIQRQLGPSLLRCSAATSPSSSPSAIRMQQLNTYSTTCRKHHPRESRIMPVVGARCLSNSSSLDQQIQTVFPDRVFPPQRQSFGESILPENAMKLFERYPDFMPAPFRNSPLMVKQCINDMLQRRTVIEVPEFYVGSVLAVTVSDTYADTKKTRFVGICIQRSGQLLKASFTLRNIIDGNGLEIRYDLYNPLIQRIEVLRLEKRLDYELIYLRDALPEYSTFPEDMKPVYLEPGTEVPLNKLLVRMNPWPWSRRWERYQYRGIEKLENVPQLFADRAQAIADDPCYRYDLMMEYRTNCTEELLYYICKRLIEHEETVVIPRTTARTQKFLRVPKMALTSSKQ